MADEGRPGEFNEICAENKIPFILPGIRQMKFLLSGLDSTLFDVVLLILNFINFDNCSNHTL